MARLLHHSDVEHVYDAPERAGRLAGALSTLAGDDTLVCGTGDDLAPGVLPLVERGRQAIPFFRAAGTAFETFGNHDFDFGPDRTLEVLAEAPPTWLTANVERDGDRFGRAEGVERTALRTVDDTRVGFFGVTDPATDSLNPFAAELTFTDPHAATERAVTALRDRGAERVVALSHLGAGDDELARRTDVDVVLGGHVHSERVAHVGETLLTRPGAGGHTVVEVDLDRLTATRHEVGEFDVVDHLAETLRGRTAAAGLDEVVGYAPDPMPRDEGTVFAGECRVGNFVADAYRHEMGADVGLANSGGIRAGPPLVGEVTRADVISLVPFQEPLVVAGVGGEQLRRALAQASGTAVDFGEPDWWHAHLSGARVVYDEAAGELVEATVGGAPLEDGKRYEVALANYLLHSDHEFTALSERDRAREGPIQHEALVAYARDHDVAAPVEGRVERRGHTPGDRSNERGRR